MSLLNTLAISLVCLVVVTFAVLIFGTAALAPA